MSRHFPPAPFGQGDFEDVEITGVEGAIRKSRPWPRPLRSQPWEVRHPVLNEVLTYALFLACMVAFYAFAVVFSASVGGL